MANPKEVYSIYVLAYAQKEARPYGEFDKTLASSLGCIHARTEEMLMPSELAAKLRDMGAEPDAEQDDDSEALRRELEHAKEQLATARGGFDAMFERDREVRAVLEADDNETTPAAVRRVVGAVPDVGPSFRDERERQDAHDRLAALIRAGGATETGDRWLFDAAADEIVRLRGEVDGLRMVVRAARDELGAQGDEKLLTAAHRVAEMVVELRSEVEKLTTHIGVVQKEADHDGRLAVRFRREAREAREQGATEMRTRAAALVTGLTSPVMKVRNFGELAERIRALPLSGAPGAHPLDADAPARRKDATVKALEAMGVPFGRAIAAARIAEEEGGAAPEAAHSAVMRVAKEHGLTFGWGGQDLRARLRRMLQQGAAGERAAARLEPSPLTDEEQALLRRGGYVERDGRWRHMWVGPERDPAKPEGLAELRRDVEWFRSERGAHMLEGLSSQDVDALVDAMWRRDGDIWRDPRGQAVDPRSAEGVALMRSVAKDARERKARGPRLIETPADGLSAEDAETLREAGWTLRLEIWYSPAISEDYDPEIPCDLESLRSYAARHRAAKESPAVVATPDGRGLMTPGSLVAADPGSAAWRSASPAADVLSPADAATLRDAGYVEEPDAWRFPPTATRFYKTTANLESLRGIAARIRERAAKAPPTAPGVTGEASGGDRAAGGKGSVAEAQGEKQGAPIMCINVCACGGVEKPRHGEALGICEACGLYRAFSAGPAPAVEPAPGALPKPARVEVGQRWRTPGGYVARVTAGPNYVGTMTLESGSPGVRVFRWPADKMLESPAWTFLGTTPQGPSPKRDDEPVFVPDQVDIYGDPTPRGAYVVGPVTRGSAEPTDGPTARDAVAGMLLRFGLANEARDVAQGDATPAVVVNYLKNCQSLPYADDGWRVCIAALEALARGDLCDPGEAERWEALALENKVKAERAARERDEARAEATAAKRGWDEEREYAARLKEERDAIRDEAIDLRAEAAALREDVERMTGRAADLERQRDEACKDALEAMRELRTIRGYATYEPLRPAEDIARELVRIDEDDATWSIVINGTALHGREFLDAVDLDAHRIRKAIVGIIERSRAEGKRAAVEEKKDNDGPVSARAEAYVSRSRESARPVAVRLPVLPADRGPAPAQAGVAPAGEGEAARGDEASDGRVSGMHIEKREDGEWLIGSPEEPNKCQAQFDADDYETVCMHHVDGHHVAICDADSTGAERIIARWPIAPAQDEPQGQRATNYGTCGASLTEEGHRLDCDEPTNDSRTDLDGIDKKAVVDFMLGYPGARQPDQVNVLYSDVAGVRLAMPKGADPRAVLATVAELLGLPPPEYEIAMEAALAHERGVDEGERRAQARHVESPTVAPDREALGRAVHATWLAALGETGRVAPPWESRDEAARERDRRVGERLFAMGIAEGERRAEEQARATARGLVEKWNGMVNEMERELEMLHPDSTAAAGRRWATGARARCADELCAAFSLPADDKPPTGGEPAPDAWEVVADRATTHVEPTAGYARRRGLAVPATGWRAEPGMRTALSPTLGQVPVAPFKPWRCECGFEADTPDCHRIMDDPSAAAPYCTLRWARNPDYVTPTDADARWQPGAVWEHRAGSLPDVATFTLQRVDANGDVVFLDANGRVCWSTRDDMTGGAGCGWRYVGPASEVPRGHQLTPQKANAAVTPALWVCRNPICRAPETSRVSAPCGCGAWLERVEERAAMQHVDIGAGVKVTAPDTMTLGEVWGALTSSPALRVCLDAELRAARESARGTTPADLEAARRDIRAAVLEDAFRAGVESANVNREEAVERAHADGIVEGLRRARRLVYAFPDIHDELAPFAKRLDRDIEAAAERAGKPVDPMRRALDKLSAAVDEIGDVMRDTVGDAPAVSSADRPHVDRAALLELATGWEGEATQTRVKVRENAARYLDHDITASSSLVKTDTLARCAAALRRLLDAPRGGERVEDAEKTTAATETGDDRVTPSTRGGRAPETMPHPAGSVNAPPDLEPLRAALRREADAFAASIDDASKADGRALRRAAGAIESERDARLVLAVLGFEPMARDRVLGTSPPAAQDGSSAHQADCDARTDRDSTNLTDPLDCLGSIG